MTRILFTLVTLPALQLRLRPARAYSAESAPLAPDYSQENAVALPWRQDEVDLTPDGLTDRQAEAEVDVFFIHLTTYNGKKATPTGTVPVLNPR